MLYFPYYDTHASLFPGRSVPKNTAEGENGKEA
jgi:hypothetical protein